MALISGPSVISEAMPASFTPHSRSNNTGRSLSRPTAQLLSSSRAFTGFLAFLSPFLLHVNAVVHVAGAHACWGIHAYECTCSYGGQGHLGSISQDTSMLVVTHGLFLGLRLVSLAPSFAYIWSYPPLCLPSLHYSASSHSLPTSCTVI